MKDQITTQEIPRNQTASLEEKLAEQVENFSEISRVGTVITSILDLGQALPVIMEAALNMVKGEVGQIALFQGHDQAKANVSWGVSDKVIKSIQDLSGTNLLDRIGRSEESVKVDNLPLDPEWRLESQDVNIISFLAVPLKVQNKVLGVVLVANKIDGLCFDQEDLFSLEMLGCFAAVAIENSGLHNAALARQKIEDELELARQIQKTLMPKKVVDLGKLAIVTHNQMAMQVGGDFYDIIELSPDKYILVVADVSSKGLPAALLMTSTRSLVRAYAEEPIDLGRLAKNVNLQLSRDSAGLKGMFVTMIMVYLDFKEGIIKSLNAGHPPGFLCYPDGTIHELRMGGPFLGQFDYLEFSQETLTLLPGSRLFLYTDGAFECVNGEGRMLGLAKLRKFFADYCQATPQQFIGKMLSILHEYSADPSSVDDTTFLLADVRRS